MAPTGSTQAEKIGYVPRNRATGMTASGLTSAGMVRGGKKPDQDLDDESRAGLAKIQETDREIDKGIDQIGDSLGRIQALAGAMKDEVCHSCTSAIYLELRSEIGFGAPRDVYTFTYAMLLAIGILNHYTFCLITGARPEQKAGENRGRHDQDGREANCGKCPSEILAEMSDR
jgi:hypothetical protein